MKFWLLIQTRNQVLRLVILKMNFKTLKVNNKNKHQHNRMNLQQVVEHHQPWDSLKEETSISILLLVPQKVWKSSEAPDIKKDSSPMSVLMKFFTQIFQLLVEQTNLYTSNTWTDKLDLAANCQTLHFRTWWLSLPWLCRWDMTRKTHFMTAGLDLDS
jgi:hypothetical protein